MASDEHPPTTPDPEAPLPEGDATPLEGTGDESAAAGGAEADGSPVAGAPTADAVPHTGAGDATAVKLPAFDEIQPSREAPAELDLLGDVNLNVKIELGRTRMLVEDVLRLKEGGVVELEKLAGDPVDIYVNDRPVARGEVLVLNDNFCVRISEILDTERAGKKLA